MDGSGGGGGQPATAAAAESGCVAAKTLGAGTVSEGREGSVQRLKAATLRIDRVGEGMSAGASIEDDRVAGLARQSATATVAG